jgi:hypothetical protein
VLRSILVGIVPAWALLGAMAAHGQAPTTAPFSAGVGMAAPAPGAFVSAAPACTVPAATTGKSWEADVIFGLPTGVRLSKALDIFGGLGPEAELFAGVYFLDPALGAGLRWRFTPYQGTVDALVVRPGLDGYALLNPNYFFDRWDDQRTPVIGLAAIDVDCAWQHQLDSACALEIGFKLGGGVAFTRHPIPVPLAGIFVGLRY